MAAEQDPGREAWKLLFQLFRSERRTMSKAYSDLGLNSAQAHLLFSLHDPAGAPMSELAEELVFDASYITGLVDRLEARGLVRRLQNPEDRRVKRVALTEAGLEMQQALKESVFRPPPAIQSLSEEDRRLLRDIFRRAVDGLQDD